MISENKVIEGFRLAPQQARLWNIPLSIEAYRAQGAWLLSGVIDTSHLQQALREVVKRHEILRTVFATLPGIKYPVQVIVEDTSYVYREVSIDDVENLTEAILAANIEHILQEEAQFAFDYQQGPHLRVCLLTLALHRYALIITLPALCADGRTLHCLMDEIGYFYTVFGKAKAKNSDAKEPVQYIQFSEWQNELLTEWQSELLADTALDSEDGRAYWRNRRYSEIQSLYLPEQNRANKLTGTVDTIQVIQIESDVLARLESLVEAQSVTLDMLLLASWYALLWRLVGQRRISLGYLCDGRKYEELTDALGLFAKWVPITCELADDYSFNELLQETKRIICEAQQWQEYFVWEEALYNETEDTQSLFSFGFNYEMRAEPHWGEEVDAKLFCQQINTDYFHLYLTCALTNNSLCIEFNYNKRSFTTEAVTRLASQYVNILHQVGGGDGVAIAELDLLNPNQKKQILYDWNQTASFFPYEKCVHQLIEEQAASSPATTALVTGFECLTYEELNRRANMLAHYLIALGVGPEKRVGILLNRSIEMFVALLGVLKAGAAYVPLEADEGLHRLRYMLTDAQLSVLLTHESLVRSLPESGAPPVICLDKDWIQISAYPDSNPICDVQPDNLIYVIYTSGSTGLPKGTLITHRGVVNYLHWSAERYTTGYPINALVHSPIAFDLTVTSVYVPWLVGGCVSIVEGGDGSSALINGLRQHGAMNNLLKVTPAHLEVLYQETLAGKINEIGQVLIVGGEALFSETVKPWSERHPELRIINEYGPTETVVGCCVYEIPPTFESSGAVPIGRPIINSQIYVLDEKYSPVPIGVIGEIYIGGMGVARGYHNRSELTAKKFVPHPYGTQPGERLYKTGDLGRYLSDENLEYVRRMDDQVKVRGYRIEPGEIEAILLGHDRVQEAIVIVRPDEPDATYAEIRNSNRLIAYIVGDKNLKSSDWQSYLRDRLPGYMIPSTFVMLDQMPLARNGKVDRQALPDPGYAQAMNGKPLVAPRSFTEEVLVSIWSEVLRVEPISIHDNFFDLGGDSMRSIQVCARAQRRGLKLTHDQIFQYRTISQLALEVRFDGTGKALQTPSIMFNLISEEDRKQLPGDVEDAYPLAMLQAGMIFHSELNPDAAIFHDQHSFHIHAWFDPVTMERTVFESMQRQAVLRTSFELSLFTQPLQLVHKFVPPPLTVDDLRHLPIESHDSTIASWMNSDKNRHFVWNQAPLIRFHVHRRSDDSFQFTMSFHHAILDGWSAATLLTELFKHYLELLVDPELPGEESLAVSYRDFVALEQEILASEEGRQYWSKQLEDVTSHRLPRLHEPKPSGVIPVEVSDVILPLEVSDGLKKMARAASIPVKSVLLAAHMKVMSLFSGSKDVVSGLVFNGRPEEIDGDRVLGLFLNTLPFRILLAGGSWRDLVEHVFEVERDSLPFRRYPLAEIQRIITSGQPLFETSFNFMHYHIYNSVGEQKDVQLLGYSGYEETNFTLTANFSLEVVSGNVHLVLNYHPTELTSQQIEAIGGYYLSVLAAMVTDPHSQYEWYNPLSANETQQLLIDWNQTAKDYGAVDLIHELFESQAKRTPDHIAVISDSAQLTYHQLNTLADGLATRLQHLGVKPEARVAILVERSIELVIGLLGILKAGGAYVPLDPSYPQERLRMMVEDSEASVMIVGSQYRELVREYSGEVVELGGGQRIGMRVVKRNRSMQVELVRWKMAMLRM